MRAARHLTLAWGCRYRYRYRYRYRSPLTAHR
jgi:hypothetical protein